MVAILALGVLAMVACLAFQALASALAAHHLARAAKRPLGPKPRRAIFRRFAMLMVVLMLGNIVQVAFWALFYRALDLPFAQALEAGRDVNKRMRAFRKR